MATNIVKSAFPEFSGLLSTPREALLAAPIEAARASRQTPMEAITGSIQGAGAQLQQSVGGLFGQVPAAVAQQDKLKEIIAQVQAQGVDLATPEGQVALAQALSQFPEFLGMATAMRQQAAEQARTAQRGELERRKIESEIAENVAQAEKARRPSPEQSPFGKINPADFTPKSVQKFIETGNYGDLVAAPKATADGERFSPGERWNAEIDAAEAFLRQNNVDPKKPLPTSKAALPGYSDAYEKANRPRWAGGTRPFAGGAAKPTAVPLPQNPSPTTLVVGTTYQTARGPATWDGKQFIPVGQ